MRTAAERFFRCAAAVTKPSYGIGFYAPAGFTTDPSAIARAVSRLEAEGHRVVVDATVALRWQRFSAADDERLAAIMRMASDPRIDIAVAVRGGYGWSRLLDRIDFAAIANGQAALAAHRQRQLVVAVPEWQSAEYWHAETRACMLDHGGDVVAVIVGAKLDAAEVAQKDRALSLQHAGEMKLVEHPLDAIRMLAGIFDEQNAAVDIREVRRSHQMRQHGQVSAPEDSFGA